MSEATRIIIEGENLDPKSDGDWTVSLFLGGRLESQTRLSGQFVHALAAANDLGIEHELAEAPGDA